MQKRPKRAASPFPVALLVCLSVLVSTACAPGVGGDPRPTSFDSNGSVGARLFAELTRAPHTDLVSIHPLTTAQRIEGITVTVQHAYTWADQIGIGYTLTGLPPGDIHKYRPRAGLVEASLSPPVSGGVVPSANGMAIGITKDSSIPGVEVPDGTFKMVNIFPSLQRIQTELSGVPLRLFIGISVESEGETHMIGPLVFDFVLP